LDHDFASLLISQKVVESILNFVVESKDEGTTSSSNDIREATLEESFTALLLVNLFEAIHCTVVKLLISSLSRGHHKSSSNSV